MPISCQLLQGQRVNGVEFVNFTYDRYFRFYLHLQFRSTLDGHGIAINGMQTMADGVHRRTPLMEAESNGHIINHTSKFVYLAHYVTYRESRLRLCTERIDQKHVVRLYIRQCFMPNEQTQQSICNIHHQMKDQT